jgi:hypothetical protein
MTTAKCDRALRCLNFWLKERPECNQCGVLITMNHFHHTLKNYRICHDCFERNLAAIVAGIFVPKTLIEGERKDCLRFPQCFATTPYSLFKPKICDGCGRDAPPEHYHDIHQNIRICLSCYQTSFLAQRKVHE